MTHKVYKYEIPAPMTFGKPSGVVMPAGAKILAVGSQVSNYCGAMADEELIFLWADVDPTAETQDYRFYVVPTGGTVPLGTEWIGTVQFRTVPLVFHIYQ
jgi:hypothetical protein